LLAIGWLLPINTTGIAIISQYWPLATTQYYRFTPPIPLVSVTLAHRIIISVNIFGHTIKAMPVVAAQYAGQ